jgi:hypothetical protein
MSAISPVCRRGRLVTLMTSLTAVSLVSLTTDFAWSDETPAASRTASAPESALAAAEIAAPLLDHEDWRTAILKHVRGLLDGGTDLSLGMTSREGTHLVMVSLSRAGKTAAVARGQGQGLEPALDDAAAGLRAKVTEAEIGRGTIKVDLALDASPVERFDRDGRARIDRSLDGIWLLEPDLVLLPEELLSRRLMDSSGDIQSKRLRRYLAEGARAGPTELEGNPARAGFPYRRIRFTSFIEGADRAPARLYRGNPVSPDRSPASLLAAADQGGRYLVRHQQSDGKFNYSYEPKRDEVTKGYNLLRHAGTCYALVELYQATGDPEFRDAADRGLDYLLTHSRGPKTADREADFEAIVSPGDEAKLGGAALAILAIVQDLKATGVDDRLDRARRLARFLLFQQDADGHFRSKYFYGAPDPKPFESIYYPGEAILALLRLYRVDPQDAWLAAARAGADWLIDVRDAGKPTSALPHDHWLLMGLDELQQLTGDHRYAAHAARIAEAIIAAQRTTSPHPDWIGSFYDPPRSTPTATRAEGLVAATRIARRTGGNDAPYLEALDRMAAFQLRCQITHESGLYLPRPDLARGGFRRSLTNWEVRIDYVQHNVSALLGLRSLLLAPKTVEGTERAD